MKKKKKKKKKRTGTQATKVFVSIYDFFLRKTCNSEVSRFNDNGKEVQKKCAKRAKNVFFLLNRPVDFCSLAVLVAVAV